jgi:hypothetical protein
MSECKLSTGYNCFMSQPAVITGDQLANALHELNVKFIFGGDSNDASLHKQPVRLIAALAESDEARLRLALIPLFLQHPEFAPSVRDAAKQLRPPARLTLQCYYTAAVFLAQIHRLSSSLPDYFSRDLRLETTQDPQINLRALADRQRELSGETVNWLGTYQHAAQIWMRALELRHA